MLSAEEIKLRQREKEFYDREWKTIKPSKIEGVLYIPSPYGGGVDLSGKKVLICSCGKGAAPVWAAKQSAEVWTFDISEIAVNNAKSIAEYNKVVVNAQIMDFHDLSRYPEGFFDVVFGYGILHHVDCAIVSRQLLRVMKSGGIAFFKENSDRNPLLRFLRRLLFGKPGGFQKERFLFFKRKGTSDEYPLGDDEISEFRKTFGKENVKVLFDSFYFFELFPYLVWKHPIIVKITRSLDALIVRLFPFVLKYSYLQNVWFRKV